MSPSFDELRKAAERIRQLAGAATAVLEGRTL